MIWITALGCWLGLTVWNVISRGIRSGDWDVVFDRFVSQGVALFSLAMAMNWMRTFHPY